MNSLFEQIITKLTNVGISSPRLEARLLIAAALDIEPAQVATDVLLNDEQVAKIHSMLAQRLQHKPLDKILGHREFYKFDFAVDENVLSPRPDTEILVEEALKLLPQNEAEILDLGTGSGCIIESILAERPRVHGVAVDISEKSLQIARKNAENLGLNERLQFIRADWFATNFTRQLGQQFALITGNPPYIPTADISALEPEVKNYDPPAALDGGSDGFASYRRIAEIAPELLQKGGYILLEAGINQADEIAAIFIKNGLRHIRTANDLSGIARCVILQKS